MELILEIDVNVLSALDVEGEKQKVVMVGFDASARGKYFSGKVVGSGVDTQKYPKDESGNVLKGSLSARYMLEGEDFEGKRCRIFIENNVSEKGGFPSITTDSAALRFLESSRLSSSVEAKENGVLVKIFKD